jgi:O-acetyl-ADP-ribose deacetylase (regulator of RNase III)
MAERSDHRIVYKEIQSAIFGEDESAALKRDLRIFIDEKAGKASAYQTRIGNTIISIVQGDITQVPAEAVAPGVNTEMDVGAGVTGAIIETIGIGNEGIVFPSPEVVTGNSSFKVGDVYIAPLGNIRTVAGWKYVISAFIHTSRLWSYPTEESVRISTKKALIAADKRNIRSIAFSAFGTGILKMKFNVSARSMSAGIMEFLKENPETSLRDIKIVLLDGPAVAPFRQELAKSLPLSAEQAERESKLTFLKDEAIEIVKALARDGQANMRPIVDLARQIHENFDPYIPESRWPAITPEMFITLNAALKYQIYLPNNDIFEIVRLSEGPDMIRGNIKQGSWREEDYLRSKIWIAEIASTTEGYPVSGLATGWFAIANGDDYRETGKKRYQDLKQSTFKRGARYRSPYEAVMAPLMQAAQVGEEDFVEGVFVNHLFQEEIKHAQDSAYVAQKLKRDNRADPNEPEQVISEILKPESILHAEVLTYLNHRDTGNEALNEINRQLGRMTIREYSGELGGAIAEMKKHMASGREELAFIAFLNFMGEQFLRGTAEEIPSDDVLQLVYLNVAYLLFQDINDWAGIPLDHTSMDVIRMLGVTPGKFPAAKALKMLEDIYVKHFWTDEERYARLPSEPFELADPFLGGSSGSMPVAGPAEGFPVRAQDFKANLTRILSEHPDQLFFMGVETDIGASQKAQIMPIYKAIDEIRNMQDSGGKPLFPNLMIRRAKAGELAAMVNDLSKEGKLNLNNAFIGARKESVDGKAYDAIKGEGRAWISAIDDSNPGDYLPVFEAITLNMMAYLNADLTAIKNFYDTISDKPIDPIALQEMLKSRIIYILPKITAFDTKELRDLYELARQAYAAA